MKKLKQNTYHITFLISFSEENTKERLTIIGELLGHSAGVHILKLSELDQNLLISGSFDKKIGVWNVKELKLISQRQIRQYFGDN